MDWNQAEKMFRCKQNFLTKKKEKKKRGQLRNQNQDPESKSNYCGKTSLGNKTKPLSINWQQEPSWISEMLWLSDSGFHLIYWLAKKLVWVLLYCEKPEWTLWSMQYFEWEGIEQSSHSWLSGICWLCGGEIGCLFSSQVFRLGQTVLKEQHA